MTRLFVYNLLYSPEFNWYSKQQPTSMEGTVRTVRSYKENPVITVPQTADDVAEDIDCGSLSDGDNSVDEDDVINSE